MTGRDSQIGTEDCHPHGVKGHSPVNDISRRDSEQYASQPVHFQIELYHMIGDQLTQ